MVDYRTESEKLTSLVYPMLRSQSSKNESLECLQAPRTASIDGAALRQVGTQWLASLEGIRLSSKLGAALESLGERLREPHVSPLRDLTQQADSRLARSGATSRCCLSTLYELDLILETFGFTDRLKDLGSSNSRRVSASLNHLGEEGSVMVRSVSDVLSVGWVLEVSQFEPSGLKRLLSTVASKESSRSAGRLLADALEGLLADSALPWQSLQGELFVGQVTLSGHRALKSLCSLMSRALPFQNFCEYHPNPASLEEVVSSFRAMRCEALVAEGGFRVSCGGVAVVVRGSREQCSLSLLINPEEMLQDQPASSFPRSTAAAELASVLLVTGLIDADPDFKEHLCETSLLKKWGNGYAQLSRAVCEIAAAKGASKLSALKRVDALYDGALALTLRGFRQVCGFQASRLVLELLASALERTREDRLPSFRADPHRTVYSCTDAEAHFLQSVASGGFSIDDEFLYKHVGEKTAITRVPVNIEGMSFPAGTLCAVRVRDGERLVTPGRLTAFSLPVAEAFSVFEFHLKRPSLISDEIVPAAFALTQSLLTLRSPALSRAVGASVGVADEAFSVS